jgi:hypothetical protein
MAATDLQWLQPELLLWITLQGVVLNWKTKN